MHVETQNKSFNSFSVFKHIVFIIIKLFTLNLYIRTHKHIYVYIYIFTPQTGRNAVDGILLTIHHPIFCIAFMTGFIFIKQIKE